jgi:hypothetical protein
VVWNMRHHVGNWGAVTALNADIALLCEATPPPKRVKHVGLGQTVGRDGYHRPWSTAVVSTRPPFEIADARASRYGRPLNLPFVNSRPGSWVAASVDVSPFGPVTAIALYGLMDEKSDASVHRSLTEMAPIFDDKRYNELLILGGDLNTWTGWRPGSHLERDRVVLERIKAYGLVDCLKREWKPDRLDAKCPCTLGEECRHTRTRVDPRWPAVPYQMDYLFASRALIELGLKSCMTLDSPTWRSRSDHLPVLASFETG